MWVAPLIEVPVFFFYCERCPKCSVRTVRRDSGHELRCGAFYFNNNLMVLQPESLNYWKGSPFFLKDPLKSCTQSCCRSTEENSCSRELSTLKNFEDSEHCSCPFFGAESNSHTAGGGLVWAGTSLWQHVITPADTRVVIRLQCAGAAVGQVVI